MDNSKASPHPDTSVRTIVRGIGSGGTGADASAIDTKDGKILRIRPLHWDWKYTDEELSERLPTWMSRGQTIEYGKKAMAPYFALAYKNRVYSKNRVLYPLKRVDWEPGGDPEKINPQNRGKSKFKEISWDEANEIIHSEITRVQQKYGPFSVFCIGEDGHKESKDIHAGGGCHANLMDKVGGYTRETRTPDSVEGFYWGGKHVLGTGASGGLGMFDPSWNVVKDVSDNTAMIVLQAGDWETVQTFAGQIASKLIRFWLDLGIKFVVIDPFCNYTAVAHDEMKWIPILPNTDAALDFGIMHVWLTEDLYDHDYVATHVVGFDKVRDYILGNEDGIPKDPAWASERCGIPEWTIKALARQWAKKPTSIGHFCGCHIRGPYSHEPARTEIYKLGMMGVGKPGIHQIHLNSFVAAKQKLKVTPQGPAWFAMKAYMFMPTDQAIPRTLVAKAIAEGHVEHYGSPAIIMEAASDQFVKYVYPAPEDEGGCKIHLSWSEKPCNQGCWNGGFKFQEAMRSPELECVITNHQWLENDSLFCDLVLPVSTCLEEADVVGGSMMSSVDWVGVQDKAIEPLGVSLSDYQIVLELAKRFGEGVEEEISYGMSIEEWQRWAYDESMIPSEIGWEELKEKQYYIPKIQDNWKELPAGMADFCNDPERFPLDTPSGKLEFYSEALAEFDPDDVERGPIAKWVVGGPATEGWTHDETLWGEKCQKYPLLIVANPGRWRIHVQGDDITWFREIETCKVKGPDGYGYEPVWMSPEEAEKRGLKNGDIVKVFNDEGIILGGTRISERMIPNSILINKGARVDPIAPGIDRGGSTNLICPPNTISKNCCGFAVTGYLVEVEKLEQAELDQWKRDYPEAFARDFDPGSGITRDAWVEGAAK